jgi:hypothetical protein
MYHPWFTQEQGLFSDQPFFFSNWRTNFQIRGQIFKLEDKCSNWRTSSWLEDPCALMSKPFYHQNFRLNFCIFGKTSPQFNKFLIFSASARQLVYPKMLQQLKFFTLGSWILKHQEEDKREWLYSEHHRPWNLFLGSCNHDVTQNDKYNFNSFNIQTFKHCQWMVWWFYSDL